MMPTNSQMAAGVTTACSTPYLRQEDGSGTICVHKAGCYIWLYGILSEHLTRSPANSL